MRIHSLDFIKGIAILLVLAFHTKLWDFPVLFTAFAMPAFMIVIGITTALTTEIYSVRIHACRFLKLLVPALPFIAIFWYYPVIFKYIPGSYFIPIVLATAIIAPIIYLAYQKWKYYVIAWAFIIDWTFEMFAHLLPYEWYRVCFLRYLFAVVLGFVIYDTFIAETEQGDPKNILAVYCGTCIAAVIVGAYTHLPFRPEWLTHNPLTFGYAALVIIAGILLVKSESVITKFGKYSYHIFLAQLAYFVVISL